MKNNRLLPLIVLLIISVGLAAGVFLNKSSQLLDKQAAVVDGSLTARLLPSALQMQLGQQYNAQVQIVPLFELAETINSISVEITFPYAEMPEYNNEPPIDIAVERYLQPTEGWTYAIADESAFSYTNGLARLRIHLFNTQNYKFTLGQPLTIANLVITPNYPSTFSLSYDAETSIVFTKVSMTDVLQVDPIAASYTVESVAEPTPTLTPIPVATATPIPTFTPVPTATNTPMPTFTPTPIPTATSTPVPTSTPTLVPTATNTPMPSPTNTPIPTNTPVPTSTPTPTTSPVAGLTFVTRLQGVFGSRIIIGQTVLDVLNLSSGSLWQQYVFNNTPTQLSDDFVIDIPLELTLGQYRVCLKTRSHLRKCYDNVQLSAGQNAIVRTSLNDQLLAGDTRQANKVGFMEVSDINNFYTDINVVIPTDVEPDAWIRLADVNHDGRINIHDFAIALSNYDRLGDEL